MNNTPIKNKTPDKKKRKFNIIDFLIILAILAIIFVVIYVVSPWSQINNIFNASEKELIYTVKLENVDEELISLIKQGDEVIDSVSKSSLGKVYIVGDGTVKSTELGYETDAEGEYEGKWIESSDKYDITIQIKTSANYEENVGLFVNGTRVAVGEEFYLRFPKFEWNGYCTEIKY